MDANNEFASGAFYAFLASIFFGSFAVPIKTKSIVRAKVDPVAVRVLNLSLLYITDRLSLSLINSFSVINPSRVS